MNTVKQQPNLDVYAVPVDHDDDTNFVNDRTGKNVDLRTYTTGYWSHAMSETGGLGCDMLDGKYGWCYCFVLAQIESRIGKASYGSALAFHMGFDVVLMAFLIPGLVATLIMRSDGDAGDSMSSFFMPWVIGWFVFFFVWLTARTFSFADTRSQVRKRFGIPNAPMSDCFVALRMPVKGLRQIAFHLKIDQAGVFDRVDTLPAFDDA